MNGRRCGVVIQQNNKLSFNYEKSWLARENAFSLSHSMPITKSEHGHDTISAFMWGLLPDNEVTLDRWAKIHHISANNCFSLLAAVGEDCPGAIQFISPEKAIDGGNAQDIDWLDTDSLESLIKQLSQNPGRSRLTASDGQFSLAGAQAKTALYREGDRWGIPRGRKPTTHILKPLADQHEGMPENEHFCLKLAERSGLTVARSEVLLIAGTQVLCSTRYDRHANADGQIVRLHQEDMCQALGIHPRKKYENEGGPTAVQIMKLIEEASTSFAEDQDRFVRALAFNFVIGGTDAHAKNYSMMLFPHKVRLAPFYDIGSYLPFLKREKGIKLAMKVGGQYEMDGILPRHWQRFADETKFEAGRAIAHVRDHLARLPGEALGLLHECRNGGLTAPILDSLVDELWRRARFLARHYGAELDDTTMQAP